MRDRQSDAGLRTLEVRQGQKSLGAALLRALLTMKSGEACLPPQGVTHNMLRVNIHRLNQHGYDFRMFCRRQPEVILRIN